MTRTRPALLRALALLVAWAAVAVPVTLTVFLHSSRTTVLAGHDAVVRPSLDGYATFDLGPFLPDFRYPSSSRVGARIDLGKTELDDYDQLIQRYAFIASQPEGQIAKLRRTVSEMATDSALTGSVVGLLGPLAWYVVGARRRRELRDAGPRAAAGGLTALAVVLLVLAHPWDRSSERVEADRWQTLASAIPEVTIPEVAQPLQVDAGLLTNGTKRLVQSAVDSYRRSLTFYGDAADRVPTLASRLHTPEKGQSVAVLVADRHDNIGMDPVARAIADAGTATWLMDAGDDTSTGSSWEAFSLESLDQAFDYDHRYTVAGNHDEGDFVNKQSASLGFTPLVGKAVDAPGHVRLLGAADPRSSGLGSWRDEKGVTFAEQTSLIADETCRLDAAGQRVSTLLVHDAAAGSEALARGCVDVVLAGHLHVQVGPTAVTGSNGKVGYSYTTGTTGGAAYAIAIGTKPRRDAMVSLVTFAGGRPVGIQAVSLSPLGDFTVQAYVELTYTLPSP